MCFMRIRLTSPNVTVFSHKQDAHRHSGERPCFLSISYAGASFGAAARRQGTPVLASFGEVWPPNGAPLLLASAIERWHAVSYTMLVYLSSTLER
jgi:hypothetical protein